MNGNQALELVKEVGIYKLSGTDGCLCMRCEVQGVYIDIACRKSGAAMDQIDPGFFGVKLRVHSRHLDAGGDELRAIANEVARQLRDEGYAILVRFCEYRFDAEMRCTYCGKTRTDTLGYLCDECLTKPDAFGDSIAKRHDFRLLDFVVPAPTR